MVEIDLKSLKSNEKSFYCNVLQKVFEMLDEPPCESLEQGRRSLIQMLNRGMYSLELIEELVDQAVE